MPHRNPTPRLVRLRLVTTTLEADFDFSDDEHPSLPGVPVYETTGDDITHGTAAAGLRKCPAVPLPEKKRRVR